MKIMWCLPLGRQMKYRKITAQSLKETELSVLVDEGIQSNQAKAQEWIA